MNSFDDKESFLAAFNHKSSKPAMESDDLLIGFPKIEESESIFSSKNKSVPIKRLNEVDSKILEDSAFTAIEDVSLKLELKMLQLNKELNLINEQIELINIVNPTDKYQKLQSLNSQIIDKRKSLNGLKTEYRNLGLFYKITDTMSSTIETTEFNLKKTKDALSNSEITNKSKSLIPFLKTRSYLVKTLNKLKKIYKKLDEMTSSKQTPWGENEESIKTFVSFMNTANKLDAHLSKFLGLKPRVGKKRN